MISGQIPDGNCCLCGETGMSDKLNAILVGAGGITGTWLPVLKERNDVKIIAVADPVRASASARISEFALQAEYYPDLEQALESVRADIVFDCSVPSAHCSNSVIALSHGCHVLSEKPMASSAAEARRIIAAAAESGKIHAVVQNRRYMNEIIAYRDVVRNGIGNMTTLNADFYIGAHFGGFRDEMEHVLLLDMAVHSFDQARFISGQDPERVFCREWNPEGSWYKHGASAVAVFTMSGGTVFTYRGSWCAEGCQTSWECDWRAIGKEGSAIWRGSELFGERVTKRGGFINEFSPVEIPVCKNTLLGHAGVINEFLECVKNGKTPQTACTDNIKSLAMVEGAIRSSEEGREIDVTELWK